MKRPNLIYIFADQLRHDTLGHAGDEKAITPNLDRLAAEGRRFTNKTTYKKTMLAHSTSTKLTPMERPMIVN